MKTLPRGGAARGREAATYGMETTLYNLPKMTDNEKTWAEFKLDIPEYYNFGYDVVERRAQKADKTAFIFVERSGETIELHSISDLNRASKRFANVLLRDQ